MLINEQSFQEWLIGVKGFGPKSARDVISRCRRAERVLDISLEQVVKTPSELDKALSRLRTEAASYLKPETNKSYAVTVIQRAARLYAEYAASQKAQLQN